MTDLTKATEVIFNLAANGHYADALDTIEYLLEDYPDNTHMLINKAMMLENMERPYDAVGAYNKVVANLEGRSQIRDEETILSMATSLYQRGVLFAGLEHSDNALADFYRCMDIIKPTPDEYNFAYDCHLQIAAIYFNKNENTDAMQEINKAISLRPEMSTAYIVRGIQHYYDGQYGLAQQDLLYGKKLEQIAVQVGEEHAESRRICSNWATVDAILSRIGNRPKPGTP